jgi:thioredoxin reductase
MEVLIENIAAYAIVAIILFIVFFYYLKKTKERTSITDAKIMRAKESGLYEPISLHPVVDVNSCIGSGACIEACPEKDILGWRNGKAAVINASRCVGHGACFHACPVQAITLCIGTEKRGVDLPHVSQEFETNVPMLFIAGEMGGMGLIKNAVEQGKQAVDNITKKLPKSRIADLDLLIIGAGPAGISGSLTAKKNNLKFKTIEQESLGGTVYNFPRAKIVMTSPMELPLHGKVKLTETSKSELITLWKSVLAQNAIEINDSEKVVSISKVKEIFTVNTDKGNYSSSAVLMAIGRRGSPRKLGVKGEEKEKVYYRLLEPELINNKKIVVVGGGDSAIESALLLADEKNDVTLSYRSTAFARLKPKNNERISEATISGRIKVYLNTNIIEIEDNSVVLEFNESKEKLTIENDLVYIFAGGELPTQFLEKTGITITKKFGDAVLSHRK